MWWRILILIVYAMWAVPLAFILLIVCIIAFMRWLIKGAGQDDFLDRWAVNALGPVNLLYDKAFPCE